MLSIIISSYQKHYFDQLLKNISETIGDGFLYEIIQIWNPNLMSITKAYNLGAEKSQYKNLLFLHEDVIFHTRNWGEKLLLHLSIKNTGIIGLAGSTYIPTAPSSWTVDEKYNIVHILQGNKQNSEYTAVHTTTAKTTPVIAVDGVFLAIIKDHFDQIIFDENINNFHGYDLDFSLRTSMLFQNYIVNDLLIQHFSNGNLDKVWLDANIKIKEKLGANFNKSKDDDVEKIAFDGFLYNYFKFYPVKWKNILFSLKFYPKNQNFKSHLKMMKKYYHYIRYSSSINLKNKDENE